MKEFLMGENQAGQRLDKYLSKLLKEAPKGFLYRMLRKKNITLNGKKAQGNEILQQGDRVKLFLSDETYHKFEGKKPLKKEGPPLSILYEDRNVLLINKPAGMLSQPDDSGQPSLTDAVTSYLLETGSLTEEEYATFHPGVCNRLDRNTTGIVAAGKTLGGLQALSALFHDREAHKEYLALAAGVIQKPCHLRGYLIKNEKSNKTAAVQEKQEGAREAETGVVPVRDNGRVTLLRVSLVTGRSHQIRSQLSGMGHPLAGDSKYGDPVLNREFREKYGLDHQLLHAYRMEFPRTEGILAPLSGKCFYAPLPALFEEILEEEGLGIPNRKSSLREGEEGL